MGLIVVFWLAMLIISLFALVKSSDYFIIYAEKIGNYFNLSSFVIGVTILAIGTSLPELVSSIVAVLKKHSEIVIADVVGSNVANIFLVIGVAIIISKKISISKKTLKLHLPFFIGSALFLFAASLNNIFGFFEAMVFLSFFATYLFFVFREKAITPDEIVHEKATARDFFLLAVSAFFIYLGANYVIKSVVRLSFLLGIGKEIIAVSAVAFGTSLPELMVSVAAAKKGNSAMAFGNVLGSNIFNSLVVMAVPALISDIIVPFNILFYAIPSMLAATLAYSLLAMRKKAGFFVGIMFVLFYLAFLGFMFC